MLIALGFFALFLSRPLSAQFSQQGSKLVGSGSAAGALQGDAVALSADGNTAIIGGRLDNGGAGAVWIWTRSNGVWSQQGPKLVGTGGDSNSQQGTSVAISADGNTAITGAWLDNSEVGAAWIWTRSGGVWTQQGSKLFATDTAGIAHQGISVGISGNGDTVIVGGNLEGPWGAAWIWSRSGGVWSQQGSKLVGSGASGASNQGVSVCLSGDGSTAIVGGPQDGNDDGAVWIWKRNGNVWTQQGPKLVGSGGLLGPEQGKSVSLSWDGNTALVGGSLDGYVDNVFVGAAWVWTRSGGVWTQQGGKLIGSGGVGRSRQGNSVSISGDGNTAIIGGIEDNAFTGAIWIWKRSGGVWTQQGSKLIGTGAVGTANQGVSVALSADGYTALVGGFGDNSNAGATWVFTAPLPTLILPRRHR
ncbi:MAG TPA: hypothetical protein VHX14_17475 [Thermoanaerobaculia bacterium]|nr:hypothetical protein [Thermoanaerobaculia bacterium]